MPPYLLGAWAYVHRRSWLLLQQVDQLLAEAIRENPRDPVPHCFLGQIARRNGNVQVAREELEQAAELPVPETWPASHVRQFLILVYTEQ